MGMINDKKQSIDKTEAQEKVLRCMFYNIYGYGDNPNNKVFPGPMDLRQQNQCKIIEKYAPQLIGFQEYDTDFRKGMAPRMSEMGYVEVPVTEQGSCIYPEGKNCEPLFYLPQRLKLICSGGELFPDTVFTDGVYVTGNNEKTKSLTWAVFEDLSSSKIFISISTHFMWSAPQLTPAQAEYVRTLNAQKVLQRIEQIRAINPAYSSAPVIMGGDLNCEPFSPTFEILKKHMSWCYDIATVTKDNLGCPGYATYDYKSGDYVKWGTPVADSGVIDYIWVQNPNRGQGITVQNYFTVTDLAALTSSDHCPKIADVVID